MYNVYTCDEFHSFLFIIFKNNGKILQGDKENNPFFFCFMFLFVYFLVYFSCLVTHIHYLPNDNIRLYNVVPLLSLAFPQKAFYFFTYLRSGFIKKICQLSIIWFKVLLLRNNFGKFV